MPWAVGVAGFIEVVKEGLMPYGDAGSGTLDLNNSHAVVLSTCRPKVSHNLETGLGTDVI